MTIPAPPATAPPASRLPPSPVRPCLPHVPTRKPRRARTRASASGLGDDLRAVRTALVKAHLGDDFGAAFDLMLFQMARAVFTPGYHDHALDIAVRETPDRPPLRANDDAFAAMSPGEAMLADRSHLSFDWLAMEDDGDAFAALCALPAGGQAAPLRRLCRAHREGPARLRGGAPGPSSKP